jgi:ribosomal protein S18 acetylase RimI-like enzyme
LQDDVCVRSVGTKDLEAIAEIHIAAFPNSLLTQFGVDAVVRNYRAHFESQGLVRAGGAAISGKLVGLYIAVCDDTPRRFIRLRSSFLVRQAVRSPGLWCSKQLWSHAGFRLRQAVISLLALGVPANVRQISRFRIMVLAIHPEYQGLGLGSMLIADAEHAARGFGAKGMYLGVNKSNARAIRFYERNGWRRDRGLAGSTMTKMFLPPDPILKTTRSAIVPLIKSKGIASQ